VERQTNQKPLFRAFVSLGTELRAALGLAASNLRIGNTYCSAEAAARAHDRRAGACGRWGERGAAETAGARGAGPLGSASAGGRSG
jgi:hypothetical protein